MKKTIIKYSIIASAVLAALLTTFLIIFFNRNVVVPNVAEISVTDAAKVLKKTGLKYKTNLEYSDTVLKDTVISQDMEAGIKIKYGTEIILVVSNGKEPVAVPDLKGKAMEDAKAELEALGFSVAIKEQFNDTVEKGKVINQSVKADKTADKGSSITLIISKGPDLVTVPNIIGMTLEKAEQTLRNANLQLKTGTQFSNSIKEGCVISQDIAKNEQVKRYSEVYANVSLGAANTKGTTQSNANNFGKITTQGDWIYFAGNDMAIYRMRNDQSQLELICQQSAVSLNVVEEWIYFCDGNVGGIYKVKIDGTEKTKISNVVSYKIYVEKGWIYYTSEYWGGILYKMKTDGSSVTKITEEECIDFVVNNDYIYYVNSTDYLVYRCETEGQNNRILCAGFRGNDLALVDKKLVVADGYNVLSVNLDGSGFNSFGTTNVQYSLLNGYDGWLYYLECDFREGKESYVFGRMKPNGSEKTTIYEYNFKNHANSFLNVANGWIYFQNEYQNDTTYRVNFAGTKVERVG